MGEGEQSRRQIKNWPKFRINIQRNSAQQQSCTATPFQMPPDISSSIQKQNYSSNTIPTEDWLNMQKSGRRAVAVSGNACSVQSYA